LGRLGGPVFNTLGFIKDNDVGLQMGIDIEAARTNLFVINSREKRRARVRIVALTDRARAVGDALSKSGEFTNLFIPLGLSQAEYLNLNISPCQIETANHSPLQST
jgi:hypothetical protein